MAEYIVGTDGYEGHWYTGERIIRCRKCMKRLPKGYRFDEFCNEAKKDACDLFSNHDFDWDYTHYFYVEPDSFCSWGEPDDEA